MNFRLVCGDFSQGTVMLSVDYLVLPGLGDLTAGALLLVTLLCFAAVNSVPGCLLTKPLDHIKGCLSPGEDLGWSCGGTPHHQKSRLKHPCDCISRLDLDLGVTSTPSTASSCCWSGWLVPLHHGSHMQLGLPHPHIPPPTTPTGKLWDRNGSE